MPERPLQVQDSGSLSGRCDFDQRVRGEITSEEYVRRLEERVRARRARDLRCWCGRRVEEHVNARRCTRWFA